MLLVGAATALGFLGWGMLTQRAGAGLVAYRFSPLATAEGYEGQASWSSDGRTVAYVADTNGVLQVTAVWPGSTGSSPSHWQPTT